MNKAQTQRRKILLHLREGGTVTALQAIRWFGCARLAARINDLRNSGHDIPKDPLVKINGAYVSQYRMIVK